MVKRLTNSIKCVILCYCFNLEYIEFMLYRMNKTMTTITRALKNTEGCQSGRMGRSRKALGCLRILGGSNPSPSAMREFIQFLQNLFVLVLPVAVLYVVARLAVRDRVEEAQQRALDLFDFEKTLGFAFENSVQELVLNSTWMIDFVNSIYFWGHFPFIILLGLAFWFKDRTIYTKFSSALVLAGIIGIVCYALFPTAPPRLMAEGHGFVDTLAQSGAPAYQTEQEGLFVNPYAALPSLHIAFAVIICWAFWLLAFKIKKKHTQRRYVLFVGGALVVVLQTVSVVATANHWIVDAVAGALLAIGAIYFEPYVGVFLRWAKKDKTNQRLTKIYRYATGKSKERRRSQMINGRITSRWAQGKLGVALTLDGVLTALFSLGVYAAGTSLGVIFALLVATSDTASQGVQELWYVLSALGGVGITTLWFAIWKVVLIPFFTNAEQNDNPRDPPAIL